MRLRTTFVIAALTSALISPAYAKAEHGPNVQHGIAYPKARRLLIQQGFQPVQILSRGASETVCDYGVLCAKFGEVMTCTGAGASYCMWLYRHERDGGYWTVVTQGDPGAPPQWERLRFDGSGPATPRDLDGLTVATPDGGVRRFRFREPTRALPLCGPGKSGPCWIKPPPGYSPPN